LKNLRDLCSVVDAGLSRRRIRLRRYGGCFPLALFGLQFVNPGFQLINPIYKQLQNPLVACRLNAFLLRAKRTAAKQCQNDKGYETDLTQNAEMIRVLHAALLVHRNPGGTVDSIATAQQPPSMADFAKRTKILI
jgi:hypothetical protein